MNLKTFKQKIDEFLETHPEAADMEVYASGDDEGIFFNAIYYDPGFIHIEDGEVYDVEEEGPNAVCIN